MFAKIITHFFQKLLCILQTVWGWLTGLCLFLIDYFAGHKFVVFLVMAVTIMDAIWGIAVSIKQGKFTLSELARLTVAKLAVYGCAMFVFVGIDKIADTILSAAIVGTVIILVEFWSSCASMLSSVNLINLGIIVLYTLSLKYFLISSTTKESPCR